jgi:hypothetical protein
VTQLENVTFRARYKLPRNTRQDIIQSPDFKGLSPVSPTSREEGREDVGGDDVPARSEYRGDGRARSNAVDWLAGALLT